MCKFENHFTFKKVLSSTFEISVKQTNKIE